MRYSAVFCPLLRVLPPSPVLTETWLFPEVNASPTFFSMRTVYTQHTQWILGSRGSIWTIIASIFAFWSLFSYCSEDPVMCYTTLNLSASLSSIHPLSLNLDLAFSFSSLLPSCLLMSTLHEWHATSTLSSLTSQVKDFLREFPDCPVVKTWCSHCHGPRFNPWSGN